MIDAQNQSLDLYNRWSGDLIIQIVMALNQGGNIEAVIDATPVFALPGKKRRIDLRGIDLSFQNLRGPWNIMKERRQRSGVNLSDCDLSYANLGWTILLRADLKRSLFAEANMCDCELVLADCTGADFSGAHMQNAWLLNTKFQNANISREQLRKRRNIGQMDLDIHAFEL